MTGRREEVKSFILKAGFALLLSLAGFLVARHNRHTRRRQRSLSPPPPPPSDLEPERGSSDGAVDEELMMDQTEEALSKIISLPALETEEDDDNDDEEQLVQEESETVLENIPAAPLTDELEINDAAAMEEEIKNLKDLVQSLQEREIWLEMKLLEFHGVKEQEASMRELQNRLKISATEMKLLSLKIESLKAENEKLRAEASDYCRAVSELEICKKNIMILESKLRYVGEQAQEKMAVLHGRVTELREKEKKDLEDDLEVEKKLRLFNELENEVFELRKENSRLLQEKVGILKKFEAAHSLNPSDIRSPDSVLRSLELWRLEEQNQLREENENLKKKLEQLQTDHCEDIEELVYLRWINACLRYELRNYQPPPGRTVARDLSRSLSPKSEQTAKQLILDYSNSHSNSNALSSIDFDLDDCFSQTSSEEFDEASLDSAKTKSTKSSKSKLFRKLKKLVLLKSRNDEKNETRASFGDTSGLSLEKKKNSTGVEFNGDEKWKSRRNYSHDLTRSSFDIHSLKRLNLEEEGNGGIHERCNSDIGAVYAHKRMISLDENSPYSSSVENEEVGDPTEDKLKKFAQVFKDSKGSLRSKRLSASSSIV